MLDAATLVVLRTGDTAGLIAANHGQFFRWIDRGLGASWPGERREIDAREPLPPGLEQAGALVLTGSPASVTERAPWMLALEAFLRHAVALHRPVLGICFGHQILAQALGGEVVRNPRGREIGTIEVERLGEDPILDGLGPRFFANATHVDTVGRLPTGATRLARSALDEVAAFRVGSALGVQFHPEIDGSVMADYLDTRREAVTAEGLPWEQLRRGARDTESGPRILQNFARWAQRRGPGAITGRRGQGEIS
jgi:GMP synthase (glutamine-hydrolysing)